MDEMELLKLETSYKDLIDQENSKFQDSDQSDSDENDPLVIDIAEALKPMPTVKQPTLTSNNSETDSCESGEDFINMENRTDSLNQIMKEQSGSTNMKQLKNYVNFYKVTKDFEQKFKSLKCKNKCRLYLSMSSLSEVKEAINNPQKESVGKMNLMKKWKSETNLSADDDLEFNLEKIKYLLTGKSHLKDLHCLEFVSEPLLPLTAISTDELYQDTERDPLSLDYAEDIKPTVADLSGNIHPKEGTPKKGLIKLRNITELVDNEISLKKKTKTLNIPVKFDLKNMKVIATKPAQTSVSSISKQYLCNSDKNESRNSVVNEEFNPKIEAAFSLADNDTARSRNTIPQSKMNITTQKLKIPYKELSNLKSQQGEQECDVVYSNISSGKKTSPISHKVVTSNAAHFNVISLETKTDNNIPRKRYFIPTSVPMKRSNNDSPTLPLSSVKKRQKIAIERSPTFFNVLNDSSTSTSIQNFDIAYPNTTPLYDKKKLIPLKQSVVPPTCFINSSTNSKTQSKSNYYSQLLDNKVLPSSSKISNVSSEPFYRVIINKKGNLCMENSSTPNTTKTKRNDMITKKPPVSNTFSETIIGNIKLVKPVNVTSNNITELKNLNQKLSPKIISNKALTESSFNINSEPILMSKSNSMQSSLGKSLDQVLSSHLIISPSKKVLKTKLSNNEPIIESPINKVPESLGMSKKLSTSPTKLSEPLLLSKTKSNQSMLVKTSDKVFLSKTQLVHNLFNKKPEKKSTDESLRKKSTVILSKTPSAAQSVELVPSTSKPSVPSNSTIAKTRLLFRKDIPKKGEYTRTVLGLSADMCNSLRKYICTWCRTGFVKKYILNQHIHRVTCNMVYECVGCSGRRILFRNRCQLLKHLLHHYGSHRQIVINYNKLKIFRVSVKDMFSLPTSRKSVMFNSDHDSDVESPGNSQSSQSKNNVQKSKNPSTQSALPKSTTSLHMPLNLLYKNFQKKKITNDKTRKKINVQIKSSNNEADKLSGVVKNSFVSTKTLSLNVPVMKISLPPSQNTNSVILNEPTATIVENSAEHEPEREELGPAVPKQNAVILENNSQNMKVLTTSVLHEDILQVKNGGSINKEIGQSKRKSQDEAETTSNTSNFETNEKSSVPTNLNKRNKIKKFTTIEKTCTKRKSLAKCTISDESSRKKLKLDDSNADLSVDSEKQTSKQDIDMVCDKSKESKASSPNLSEELESEADKPEVSSNKINDENSTENHTTLSSDVHCSIESINGRLDTGEETSDKQKNSPSKHASHNVNKESPKEKSFKAKSFGQSHSTEEGDDTISSESETSSPLDSSALCHVCKKNPKTVCFNVKNPPNLKYTCTTYCLAVMSNLCTLTIHKNLHERKKPFICPACGKEFDMYKHLSSHMTTVCKYSNRVVVSKCFYCDHCIEYQPNSNDAPDSMETHFSREHLGILPEATSQGIQFTCKICSDIEHVLPIEDKNLHFKFHFRDTKILVYRFKCDKCSEIFTNRTKLNKHPCEKIQ